MEKGMEWRSNGADGRRRERGLRLRLLSEREYIVSWLGLGAIILQAFIFLSTLASLVSDVQMITVINTAQLSLGDPVFGSTASQNHKHQRRWVRRTEHENKEININRATLRMTLC